MTKRINLISGPRNISTALMYAWANRPDTTVVDEPMYAYYLKSTGITYHPGIPETMAAMPSDLEAVKKQLIFQIIPSDLYFIKGMAHHYVHCNLNFLLELENVFLIRHPKQLIASFSKIIEHPTMMDIGLKREWEIYNYLRGKGKSPIVLDSNIVLTNPKTVLTQLCDSLSVPFDEAMLRWKAGPIPEDGAWAKYWYHSVWQSTGWGAPDTTVRILPNHLISLYDEAMPYYEWLKAACIS